MKDLQIRLSINISGIIKHVVYMSYMLFKEAGNYKVRIWKKWSNPVCKLNNWTARFFLDIWLWSSSTDSFDQKCYPPEYVISGHLKKVESGFTSRFQTQKFQFSRRTWRSKLLQRLWSDCGLHYQGWALLPIVKDTQKSIPIWGKNWTRWP